MSGNSGSYVKNAFKFTKIYHSVCKITFPFVLASMRVLIRLSESTI